MKEKLLELLRSDPEIQDAIKNILCSKEDKNIEKFDMTDPSFEKIDKKTIIDKLEKTIKEERDKNNDMVKTIKKIKNFFRLSEEKNQTLESKIVLKDDGLRELEEEKNKLMIEIENIKKEFESEKTRLDKEIETAKIVLNEKKSEISEEESKNNKLNEKIAFYRNSFEEYLRIYALYTEISDNTKDSLKGIFKDDTLKGFLACGVQDRNISSLWDYIKNEIIEDKNEDISKLRDIFNFLFDRYSMAYPIFELQNVKLGDNFSDSEHIRHSSSKEVSGAISNISFLGWINNKTNKIVKKSIVRMG